MCQRVSRFRVELVDFLAKEETSDEHVSAFMCHGLHDVEVFPEQNRGDDNESHHADAQPHITLIEVGAE